MKCFLYNHKFPDDLVNAVRLPDHITPEILRTPLHELALSIKLLQLGDVEQFLSKAMERPSQQSITEALVTLQGRVMWFICHHLYKLVKNIFSKLC